MGFLICLSPHDEKWHISLVVQRKERKTRMYLSIKCNSNLKIKKRRGRLQPILSFIYRRSFFYIPQFKLKIKRHYLLFENKIQLQKSWFWVSAHKNKTFNKGKKIEKVQARDSPHDLYHADLFPKKLCPTALFTNPTCASWQKGTDVRAETDHLVVKQWNYRGQAFISLLLERAFIRETSPIYIWYFCHSARMFHPGHLYSFAENSSKQAHTTVSKARSYILPLSHQSEEEKLFEKQSQNTYIFQFPTVIKAPKEGRGKKNLIRMAVASWSSLTHL